MTIWISLFLPTHESLGIHNLNLWALQRMLAHPAVSFSSFISLWIMDLSCRHWNAVSSWLVTNFVMSSLNLPRLIRIQDFFNMYISPISRNIKIWSCFEMHQTFWWLGELCFRNSVSCKRIVLLFLFILVTTLIYITSPFESKPL